MNEQQLPAELAALVAAEQDAEPEVAPATKETLNALVSELIEKRHTIEELKAVLKTEESAYDEIRKRRLPDLMQELGLVRPDGRGGFTHESGAKIHLRVEVYAYCKAENQAAMHEWLRENGYGDLIKETVHAQTLKAFAKECLTDGAPLPPQLTVTPETVAVAILPRANKGDSE